MSSEQNTQPDRDNLIGRQIGHYKIVRELGRGGMATVYLAQQTTMNDRQVAIKVLPREFLHDPQFIERFKREVTLVAELEHPHILPVYDFGEIDRIPFIVMRYLAGGSLRDQIEQGLPPLADLERPIKQVCAALDFAHAEGIIHRDLKPSNIMLDERGNAYLSDFGIAQIMQDAGRLTGSAVIGTPAYMSPEQAEGRPLDARSDVYALGVVLFEMVTGREPYQADTPMAMLLKQITEPMPSPRAYRPDLPEAVEEVILRATLKDPAGRYPSAGAFAEAFSEALSGLSVSETSVRMPLPSAVERTYVPGTAPAEAAPQIVPDGDEAIPTIVGDVPPTAAASATAASPAAPASQARPAGRRGLWIGLALLLVLILAGGGILLASGVLSPGAQAVTPPPPFQGAEAYRGPDDLFQIAVPGGWQREEETTDSALHVLWAAPDDSAFISVYFYNTGDDGAAGFSQTVERYDGSYYSDERLFTPIDRAPQENGALRISYRVPQPEALYGRFGPGQLDLFYGQAGPYFLVMEAFTADDADPAAALPLLQNVLDSLYVNTGVAWGVPGSPRRESAS